MCFGGFVGLCWALLICEVVRWLCGGVLVCVVCAVVVCCVLVRHALQANVVCALVVLRNPPLLVMCPFISLYIKLRSSCPCNVGGHSLYTTSTNVHLSSTV